MASRISDAFPPDVDEEAMSKTALQAKVHAVLKTYDREFIQALKGKVYFKETVTQDQLDQLRDLHKEFFPIPYQDSFFEMIVGDQLKVFNCLVEIESNDG